MYKFISCLFVFIFSSFIYVDAQKGNYQQFNNISVDKGTSVITCFTQDKQGMIWVGTEKGLYSYDGYSAQSHFWDTRYRDSWIYCMDIVDEKYIYLGTDNGLMIYDIEKDRYVDSKVAFPKDVRTTLYVEGELWIGTLQGLFKYEVSSSKLDKVDISKNSGIPHSTIYSIISSKNGNIYIGTYNGLCRYDSDKDKFYRVNIPLYAKGGNLFVNSLYDDVTRKCIWIGTEKGLLKYTPRDGKVSMIDDIYNNSVKSLSLDKKGTLFVGTDNGLFTYNDGGVKHILHDARNIQSLSNNVIWDIFRDRSDNMWLGSNSGISLVHSDDLFKNIPVYHITGIGDGNQFYSILKDSYGYYWLGGGNGIMRFKYINDVASDMIWYRIDNRSYPLPHNRIRHTYQDRDNDIWIATDGSINRYDYKKRQFIKYNITDKDKRYNSNWAYYLYEDEKGRLWVATCLGGIFVVDKDKLINSKYSTVVADYNVNTGNGLSGMFMNQLVPDGRGNIWALIYNAGIDCIDMNTFKVTHLDTDKYTSGSKLNYLMRGAEGNMWVSFRGGILSINPIDKSVRRVKLNNLDKNEVLYMQDVDNTIWASTTGGLVIIDKSTLKINYINNSNKNFTAIYYDKQLHNVILGYTDGFSITSADISSYKEKELPVIITSIYVNGDRIELTDCSSRYCSELELSYDQNNFSIDISDLTYPLEHTSKYIYKIEEIDDSWNELSQSSNRISYNHLNPGKYKLFIARLDEKGNPSGNIKELNITITPPIYLSIWAKIIYTLFAIGLIFWAINFYRMRSRLHIERKEKEHILQQSRDKIEFFTNLSHDLKTPLSLIIGPVSRRISEVTNQHEKKVLDGVLRNSMKLNSLIHQVLDFNKIDSDSNSLLILSHTDIISFSEKIHSSYKDMAKEKDIALTFESDIKSLYVDIDIIKWESILDNILSNSLKYTPQGKEISFTINLDVESSLLTVKLRDTGVGIPEKDLPYIFQRFFQSSITKEKKEGTGIGLYLVKKYVEMHGATVDVSSKEKEGTLVTIKIPVVCDNVTIKGDDSKKGNDMRRSLRPMILIVDDNIEMLDFIEELFSSRYECVRASSGSEGVGKALSLIPDIIITDLMMPGMSGIEMCMAIRKNVPTSTIPVILLTAKSDKVTELESIRSNIDAFIPKPFEADILSSRVEQLLISRNVQQTKSRIEVISQPKQIEAVSFDEKFLMEITQIIEDHISDSDFNVNALSEISSISVKQIYRKIKQLTGQSPVEYIKSIRMKKAMMLIEQKKFTISEVMYMVGFSSSSYFSKCFQNEYGMTPKQYMDKG